MPNRKRKKAVDAHESPDLTALLRKAMSGRPKAQLVDVLMELAEADRRILRQLTVQFDVTVAAGDLVAATHQAIIEATAFDMRDAGHNFDYDDAAYDAVKKNLKRLIDSGHIPRAMELSLELMKRGSYQAEYSDEGLMAPDIEDCLSVVLRSLAKCDLPPQEIIAWCSAMLRSDRVEFIATEQLEALRHQFQKGGKI